MGLPHRLRSPLVIQVNLFNFILPSACYFLGLCVMFLGLTLLSSETWVVSGVVLKMIGNGMNLGVATCILPALQAPDSTIAVDLDSWSWLNAATGMSTILTYLASAAVMASYGRRFTTIICLVPPVIGTFISYLASDYPTLFFGRLVSTIGAGSVVASVVIAEYTSPEYRGVFLNLKVWSISFGFTLIHILGHYIHWRFVMLIIMVPYVSALLMAFTWPESPAWLTTQKRFDECKPVFHRLRGKSEDAIKELDAMIEAHKVCDNESSVKRTCTQKVMQFAKKLTKRNFLKPLGICCVITLLLEATGRHVFPVYAMQIIQQMDSNGSNVFFYTICIDLVINISTIFSTVLIKVVKRKTLLLSSGLAPVIVLLAVSLYYYFRSMLLISEDYNALAFVLFGAYFVFINGGCTAVLFTLMAEIFPLEQRSIGSAMSGVLTGVFAFISLKTTPLLLETIEVYGNFAANGIIMGACLTILYLILPETKDKTLQEIEEHFDGKLSKKQTMRTDSNNYKTEDLEVKGKLL